MDIYLCEACEGVAPQWVGRCPHCGRWNTLVATRRADAAPVGSLAVSLHQVEGCEATPMSTGVVEMDRVLGGGFVAGSVTLVFGPPGVGKSTLLFQVLSRWPAPGRRPAGLGRGVADPGRRPGRRGSEPSPSTSWRWPGTMWWPLRRPSRATTRRWPWSTPSRRSPTTSSRGRGEPGPGQGVRGPADAPGQGHRGAHRPGRPRHQGRRPGRPPGD